MHHRPAPPSELISIENFMKFIITPSPNIKADIIFNMIKHKFILKTCPPTYVIYMFNSQLCIYYKHECNIEDFMLTQIELLLFQSYGTLKNEEVLNEYIKNNKFPIEKIFSNNNIKTYLPQLKAKLQEFGKSIKFDGVNLYEIHFTNGYYDIRDKTLKKRDKKIHFITKYIDREWVEPTQDNIDEMLKIIKKIYPIEADMKYIFQHFGIALTGRAIEDQSYLLLLGDGSSGKSTLLIVCKSCLTNAYFISLNPDTFSNGNSKAEKILNSFMSNEQLRIAWVNEPVEHNINISLFKTFCDGKLTTTQLYKDGSSTFSHNCKAITTTNSLLSFGKEMDTGVDRRIDGIEHISKFVNDIKETDEDKYIFMGNKNYSNENYWETQPHLLNAFFKIIADYAYDWINGVVHPPSNNVTDTKNMMKETNNIHLEFFEKNYKVSKVESEDKKKWARISKDIVLGDFKCQYPQLCKGLTDKNILTTIISQFKQFKIEYDKGLRYGDKNNRGCFIHICRIEEEEDEDEEDESEIVKQLVAENKKLLKRVEELELLLKAKEEPEPEEEEPEPEEEEPEPEEEEPEEPEEPEPEEPEEEEPEEEEPEEPEEEEPEEPEEEEEPEEPEEPEEQKFTEITFWDDDIGENIVEEVPSPPQVPSKIIKKITKTLNIDNYIKEKMSEDEIWD